MNKYINNINNKLNSFIKNEIKVIQGEKNILNLIKEDIILYNDNVVCLEEKDIENVTKLFVNLENNKSSIILFDNIEYLLSVYRYKIIKIINELLEEGHKILFFVSNVFNIVEEIDYDVSILKLENIIDKETLYYYYSRYLNNLFIQKGGNLNILQYFYKYLFNQKEEIKVLIQKINFILDLIEDKNIDILKIKNKEQVKEIINEINVKFKNGITKKEIKKIYKSITKKIIGQDNIVKDFLSSIYLKKNNIINSPLVSLFLGPTGVGKTELAKQIANNVFGSKDKMLIINSNEIQSDIDVYKLWGANPGYIGYGENTIVDKIKSIGKEGVILFDEIEKADTSFYDKVLKVIEEGYIEDNKNERIDISNYIIIFTSNSIQNKEDLEEKSIGFSIQTIKDNTNEIEKKIIYKLLSKGFRIEFLNRISKFYLFNSLSKSDMETILNKYIKEKELNVLDIKISKEEKEEIIEQAIKLNMGGRKLIKAIDNLIAKKQTEKFKDLF